MPAPEDLCLPCRYPKAVILGFSALVLASLSWLSVRGLRTDNGAEVFLAHGGAAFDQFQEFRRAFGADETIVFGVQSNDGFGPELLATLARLESDVRAVGARHLDPVTGRPAFAALLGPHQFSVVEERAARRDFAGARRLPFIGPLLLAGTDERPTALLVATLDGTLEADRRTRCVGEIEQIVAACDDDRSDVALTGIPVLNLALDRGTESQSRTLLPFLALISLTVLALLVRSILGALLIASTTAVTIPTTLTILGLTGTRLNAMTTSIPAVLMVLGCATSLHIYRAFLSRPPSNESPARQASAARARVLRPCFLASIATASGFLALLLCEVRPLREMGAFTAGGILLSNLTATLLLPAVFALGFRPRSARNGGLRPRYLPHPLPRRVLPFFAIAVIAALFGGRSLDVESTATGFLPRDHPVARSNALLGQAGFGLSSIELLAVTSGTEPPTAELLASIARAQSRLANVATVTTTSSVVDVLSLAREHLDRAPQTFEGRVLAAQIAALESACAPDLLPHARRGVALAPALAILDGPPPAWLVRTLGDRLDGLLRLTSAHVHRSDGRTQLRIQIITKALEVREFSAVADAVKAVGRELEAAHPGLEMRITGLDPLLIEMQAYLLDSQIQSVLGAAALVSLVLLVGLRSWRLALLGLIPNLVPLVFLYGGMGWLGLRLDVATVMVGAAALGIAIDDTVHLLSTYDGRRGRARGVVTAVRKVWWPVVTTSIMSASGFSVLALSTFAPIVRFGFLTAAAMILALICDLMLLPALLLVFGPRSRVAA